VGHVLGGLGIRGRRPSHLRWVAGAHLHRPLASFFVCQKNPKQPRSETKSFTPISCPPSPGSGETLANPATERLAVQSGGGAGAKRPSARGGSWRKEATAARREAAASDADAGTTRAGGGTERRAWRRPEHGGRVRGRREAAAAAAPKRRAKRPASLAGSLL
jgi:hypothetical protein